MDLPELYIINEFVPVPRVFYSDATQEPFAACIDCGRHLLEDGTQYIVEKAFRSYKGFEARDTVFEYALCLECRDALSETLSAESKERIDAYFAERTDLVKRREALLSDGKLDVDEWIGRCVVTGERTSAMEEYQILCQCDGSDMLFGYVPYAIGGNAIDEVVSLLSNATIDELNGFSDQHLGIPPELEDIFAKRVLLI